MNDVSAARHITALYRIGSLEDIYAPSGSLECKSRTGSNYGNWDLLICWQKSSAIATCQGSQDAEHHLPSVAFAAVAFVGRCSERPAAADIMAIGSPWSK